MTQTAKPETGGVFECGSCADFYSNARMWEQRYHNAVGLVARAAYRQPDAPVPGVGGTWNEKFKALTGEDLAAYIERNRRRAG